MNRLQRRVENIEAKIGYTDERNWRRYRNCSAHKLPNEALIGIILHGNGYPENTEITDAERQSLFDGAPIGRVARRAAA